MRPGSEARGSEEVRGELGVKVRGRLNPLSESDHHSIDLIFLCVSDLASFPGRFVSKITLVDN